MNKQLDIVKHLLSFKYLSINQNCLFLEFLRRGTDNLTNFYQVII